MLRLDADTNSHYVPTWPVGGWASFSGQIIQTLSLLLDVGSKSRTGLIVLPFAGVLIDILAMWLKGFVSPAFFWLHVPGGRVFAVVFGYVSLRARWEMWWASDSRQISKKVGSSL